jgi:hypothetical protein
MDRRKHRFGLCWDVFPLLKTERIENVLGEELRYHVLELVVWSYLAVFVGYEKLCSWVPQYLHELTNVVVFRMQASSCSIHKHFLHINLATLSGDALPSAAIRVVRLSLLSRCGQ